MNLSVRLSNTQSIRASLDPIRYRRIARSSSALCTEGVRQVHDGDKLEYEFRPPEEILGKQKNHAE
jgi:hypothetical protein